jgi:hypothetical protein
MLHVKLSGKQIAGIIFSVFIATAIANYEDFLPYSWQTYSAPDRSFSVQLPGKPEVEDQRIQVAPNGTVTSHQVSTAPTKTTTYGCYYFEDPRLGNAPSDKVLDVAMDGAVSKIQGSVIHEEHLDVSGHLARDAEVRARGNALVEMRLIVVGQRTFMLMVVDARRRSADTKNVRKFFDSLKFAN